MAKDSFSIRLDRSYLDELEAAAAARAELLGLSGYRASVGAYVRELIPLGEAVMCMRDGIPVSPEKQAAVFTDPFLRGVARTADAIYNTQTQN